MKKRYIVYIDVGNLPPSKAEERLEYMTKQFKPLFKKKHKVVYVANRGDNAKTYVECII